MMHMVKKDKVLGWAKSRKGLERDEVRPGRQSGPPSAAVLAASERVPQASGGTARNPKMLAMRATLKSLCKDIGAEHHFCPDHGIIRTI